jgi:protease-4
MRSLALVSSPWVLAFLSWLTLAASAAAQVTSPIAPATGFPISIVSPDNAAATSINPSALGALAGWSLAYSHVDAADGSAYADRSDAAWFATRLGSSLGLGTGFDLVRSRTPGLASSNGFLLGASINPARHWSWGATYHMRSPRSGAANVHSADLAVTFRPAPTLGVSLMGRDLAANTLQLGAKSLRRSGVLAVAARPLGDDRLVLEIAGLVDQARDTGARVAVQAYVPWVGRVAAAGEVNEASGREIWTLSAGVDLRWGGLSVAPALHGGKDGDGLGWSLLADVHGQPRPGLPAPRYVAKVKLAELGPRALLSAVRGLELALHDPRIKGVVLEPSGTGAGLASAQEVRLMISALQAANKPVYCHLEAASGSEYYLCAGAKRISIDPAGLVRLMGVSSDALYLGQLLRDVGVRADFVRIGRYKSAPEQYTNAQSSEAAREERKQLLDDAYGRLVHDLAKDTALSETEVRALLDRGPFLPQEALAAKLVHAETDAHDLERDAEQLYGARLLLLDQGKRAAHARFGPTGQIGVVVIDGAIVDGENVDVPFFDIHMSGGRTVVEAIDRLTDDPRIRAIVLRIDSPGGAVMASDQIWRAVKRARAKKPVVASMGAIAASGGYYVASAASEIWASPSTITGSIGIFYGKVDVAPLATRFGVGIESDKRGAHAGADSMFRPFSDEERAALVEKLRLWYRQFLGRVSEGRKLPIERVDALARGRVYSGDAAQRLGLVDSLGGFGSALARARSLAGLPIEADVVVVPRRPSTLLDYVLGVREPKSEAKGVLPAALRPFLSQLYLLSHIAATEPVALYEGPAQLE